MKGIYLKDKIKKLYGFIFPPFVEYASRVADLAGNAAIYASGLRQTSCGIYYIGAKFPSDTPKIGMDIQMFNLFLRNKPLSDRN